MTKEEFKTRWESNDEGGGITFEDIANCAVSWGISSHPRTEHIFDVRYRVLKAAGTNDAESFKPDEDDDEDEDDEEYDDDDDDDNDDID